MVSETIEVFRENAESGAARDAAQAQAALAQFAAEFARPRRSLFDQVIDGLNRIPRPAMALGTLALFVSAMVDPIWFASRMQGISLVPEPLWWLLGAIVGFYFGARHQAKGQEFQRSIAETLARTAQVTDGIAALRALEAGSGSAQLAAPGGAVVPVSERPGAGDPEAEVTGAEVTGAEVTEAEVIDIDSPEPNAAVAEWKDAHS